MELALVRAHTWIVALWQELAQVTAGIAQRRDFVQLRPGRQAELADDVTSREPKALSNPGHNRLSSKASLAEP